MADGIRERAWPDPVTFMNECVPSGEVDFIFNWPKEKHFYKTNLENDLYSLRALKNGNCLFIHRGHLFSKVWQH